MILNDIIFVHLLPHVMDAHVFTIYINNTGTESYEINIHVIVHSLLHQSVPEHGIAPVTPGGPQGKSLKADTVFIKEKVIAEGC